jgi:hypothetical protein
MLKASTFDEISCINDWTSDECNYLSGWMNFDPDELLDEPGPLGSAYQI